MVDQLTDENIMAALSQVKDPEIGKDLVSLGMVKSIEITGSTVDLTVELTTPACPLKAKIESDIVDGLAALGATTVDLYGLGTDGDVNDDDTFYVGLRCD